MNVCQVPLHAGRKFLITWTVSNNKTSYQMVASKTRHRKTTMYLLFLRNQCIITPLLDCRETPTNVFKPWGPVNPINDIVSMLTLSRANFYWCQTHAYIGNRKAFHIYLSASTHNLYPFLWRFYSYNEKRRRCHELFIKLKKIVCQAVIFSVFNTLKGVQVNIIV